MPNVPTYAEQGFAGIVKSSWAGFFASAKVPAAIAEKQAAAIAEILKDKEVNDRLVAIGFAPMSGTKADSTAFFSPRVAKTGARWSATSACRWSSERSQWCLTLRV